MIVETRQIKHAEAYDTGDTEVTVMSHDAANGTASVSLTIRAGGVTIMSQLGIAKAREVAHAMLDMANACDAALTKELQA